MKLFSKSTVAQLFVPTEGTTRGRVGAVRSRSKNTERIAAGAHFSPVGAPGAKVISEAVLKLCLQAVSQPLTGNIINGFGYQCQAKVGI